jgi:hypothetical protein
MHMDPAEPTLHTMLAAHVCICTLPYNLQSSVALTVSEVGRMAMGLSISLVPQRVTQATCVSTSCSRKAPGSVSYERYVGEGHQPGLRWNLLKV